MCFKSLFPLRICINLIQVSQVSDTSLHSGNQSPSLFIAYHCSVDFVDRSLCWSGLQRYVYVTVTEVPHRRFRYYWSAGKMTGKWDSDTVAYGDV